MPTVQSAVLLYLFPRDRQWHTVLMKRPAYDGVHSGQVGIPGGRLEPGEDHREAALREFQEETGIQVPGAQVLGRLSALFIPVSSYQVEPFVAYAASAPLFEPDPFEVDELIELPLGVLCDDATVKCGHFLAANGLYVDAPYFDVAGHQVWGATAMILSELRQVLREL